MIRILHSVSNMDRAGIETMLMNYYRNINKNEIQFDFLCNKKKIGAYEEEIKKLGGNVYRTPGLNPLKFFQYKSYMKKLFKEHPEYKIIHAHNGAFAVYSLFCARKNKIPIRIFHGHNSGFPIDLKLPLKLFCKKQLKYNYTEKWACGEGAVEFYYGKDTLNNKDYEIIHNAIDIDRFKYNLSERKRIRELYNIDKDIVIGHVGRFSPIKNHSFLIKIFNELSKTNNNVKLVLIGDGENEMKIRDMVKRLDLNDKVLFLGNIPNVNEWYQAFDLFILPSINEGLPVVGVEAQAAGLPCIFSNSIPHEIDITGNCIFIDLKEEIRVWTNNIEKIVKEYQRKDTSKLLIEKGYSIKEETNKLENLYLKLYNEYNSRT